MKHCYIVSLYFERSGSSPGYYSTLAVNDTPEAAIRIVTSELEEKFGQDRTLVIRKSGAWEVGLEFLEEACQILRSQGQ